MANGNVPDQFTSIYSKGTGSLLQVEEHWGCGLDELLQDLRWLGLCERGLDRNKLKAHQKKRVPQKDRHVEFIRVCLKLGTSPKCVVF